MNRFVSLNGKMHPADSLLLSADNRSFRYGDGFFETMKVVNGGIVLEDLHMERLFSSLDQLQFKRPAQFTPAFLRGQVSALAEKNGDQRLARIRITIFRGDGGLYEFAEHRPHCVVQSWGIDPATQTFNSNGLHIGIYPDARKSCDAFAPIKSNNYLAYAMAAIWAKEQQLNDAILLNTFNRVSDATIANVFIVKDGIVKTPALSEGCVAGVMRRHLLQSLRKAAIPVYETEIGIEELVEASEIFLTNAIAGIKWVKQLGDASFGNQLSSLFYHDYIQPLLSR